MLQDHLRHLLAGHAVRDGDLHLLRDGRLQPVLDHEPDDERWNQEDEVETEAVHVENGTCGLGAYRGTSRRRTTLRMEAAVLLSRPKR